MYTLLTIRVITYLGAFGSGCLRILQIRIHESLENYPHPHSCMGASASRNDGIVSVPRRILKFVSALAPMGASAENSNVALVEARPRGSEPCSGLGLWHP